MATGVGPHAQILEILSSRMFDRFKGLREGSHFEAKGKVPYDLNSAAGRYELAKDVTAFANSEGGHIVVGLQHTRLSNENTDEVHDLDLFPQTDFPVAQIGGVLKEYVHPKIKDLVIDWTPSLADETRGVGYIYVPRQPDEQKFFLVTRILEDGEALRQIVVGIAVRKESSNIPLTPDTIHRYVRDGYSPTAQRLTGLEEKMDRLIASSRPTAPSAPEPELDARIRRLLGDE
jgi:hypothetical protein